MLERHSGDRQPAHPAGVQLPDRHWLDFFCFTAFTDRDGKYQLASLAESSFDPLARSTQFMLAEEAYHMQTGENGIGRILKRTAELMREGKDPRKVGAIPLRRSCRSTSTSGRRRDGPVRRRGLDQRAESFASGLKGRYREGDGIYKDPKALDANYRSRCRRRQARRSRTSRCAAR
jgi:benzoyl-CoA 2,3-dioxygenase component B